MAKRKRKAAKSKRKESLDQTVLKYSATSLVVVGAFGLFLSSLGNPNITGYAVLRPDVQASANILLLISSLCIIAGVFIISHLQK